MPGHAFSSLILSALPPLAAISLTLAYLGPFPSCATPAPKQDELVSDAQARISGLLGGGFSNGSRLQRGLQNQP